MGGAAGRRASHEEPNPVRHRAPRYLGPVSAVLTTNATELGDSRVRLDVKVPAGDVERRVLQRAEALGRELKIPGFRRGHVPAPMVLKRLGREAVLEEAIRESLTGWYGAAIDESGVVPVGDPKIDLGDLPSAGEDLDFTIEIGVLPRAKLGEYKGLEVPRREPTASDEIVDQEVDAMRDRLARLETVERAAANGDFAVIDYVGSLPTDAGELEPFEGGTGHDQLVELGSESLIAGFEEGLVGAQAGQEVRSPSTSRRTTARSISPAARQASPSTSRRSASAGCRSSTTTSRPTPASTRSTSCAPTSPSASRRPTSSAARPSSARRHSMRQSSGRRCP